jgi:hypothetical protein
VGVYQVVQTAVSCGVRRLVLASSLHAVSAASDQTQVRVGDPPRPGNLYGATKAWAEALGAWVAASTPTSVVALRISYFSSQGPDAGTVPTQELSAWLSPRDAAELVRAAVGDGWPYVRRGQCISANRYRRADLKETVQQLGYRPVDDAWQPQSTHLRNISLGQSVEASRSRASPQTRYRRPTHHVAQV